MSTLYQRRRDPRRPEGEGWIRADVPNVSSLLEFAAGRGEWTYEMVMLDLRLFADRERMTGAARPGRPTLVKRWGWKDHEVREALTLEADWEDPRILQQEAGLVEALCAALTSSVEGIDWPREEAAPAARQPHASAAPAPRQPENGQTSVHGSSTPAARQPRASRTPAPRPTRVGSRLHASRVHINPPPTPAQGRGSPLLVAAARWLATDGQAYLPLVLAGGLDSRTLGEVRRQMHEARRLPDGTRRRALDAALKEVAPSVVVQAPPPRPPPPPTMDHQELPPVAPHLAARWALWLAELEREIDPEEVTIWLREGCAPVEVDGDVLRLQVVSPYYSEWVSHNYGQLLTRVSGLTVEYWIGKRRLAGPAARSA